jgi:FixJ family two-component response regulator
MTEEREIKRILVVDDDHSICTMLVKSLQSCGYYCQSTTDPIKSLTILRQGAFELLISDIEMDAIDGIQLIKEVSEIDLGIDTIIMTGYTQDYTYSDIIKAGAADFIAKPFQNPELKAKIERIDRERRMRRELKEMNAAIEAREKELEKKARELEETNVALRVLLNRREDDKKELIENVMANIEELILPYLEKLEASRLSETQRTCLGVLKSGLAEISSPFVRNLSFHHLNLSPMEMRVAILIRAGKGNKEIAETLGVSVNTIMSHRYNLRTKCGLKGRRVNLTSYLASLTIPQDDSI